MNDTGTARESTIREGGCHCGEVRFRLTLPQGFADIQRCNCSICLMKGIAMMGVKRSSFELLQGEELLTLYQFNTGDAKHYFCSRCGIYTHHQRRSDTSQYGVNAACIDGMNPLDFPETNVIDGVNHPMDNKGRWRLAGVMRFEAAE